MNKNVIAIRLGSLPIIVATGYVCYKLGDISGRIKAYKTILDFSKKPKDDIED